MRNDDEAWRGTEEKVKTVSGPWKLCQIEINFFSWHLIPYMDRDIDDYITHRYAYFLCVSVGWRRKLVNNE